MGAARRRRRLVGGLPTRTATPKVRHIARVPYVSCSYWWEQQDVAVAECHATRVEDPVERRRVWEFVAAVPPPAGFDPAILGMSGPQDPGLTVVRLDLWLLRFAAVADLTAGGVPEVHRIAS